MRARLVLVLACLLCEGIVVAAPPKPAAVESEAAKKKKDGDRAMLELRYEDALALYAASYALEPNPALHYNRARAYEALGRHAEALSEYESFAKEASADLRAKVPQLAEHIAAVRKRVSELHLKIRTPSARVMIRNVMQPFPLPDPLRLNAGKATIEVTADGFVPFAREVDLPGGESLTLEVDLKKKSSHATLAVKVDPPATVSVDGTAFGTSPIEAQVSPGTHTITLARGGYVTRTSSVVVSDGERKDMTLTLESEPGITSRWWFWASAGVVVVGATAVTIGLLTSRDAGKGDIAPGKVAAPLIRF